MPGIREYFNLIAKELDVKSKKAGLTDNNADIGFNREIITQDFLSKHLPRRLKPILGGTIFGNDNTDSKQIDIIVSNDISINFEDNAKMFVAIENVASAISVKSVFCKSDKIKDINPEARDLIKSPVVKIIAICQDCEKRFTYTSATTYGRESGILY